MNKLSILLVLLLALSACQNDSSKKKSDDNDSTSPEISFRAQQIADSLIENATKTALFDTMGLHAAPVKVISSRLVRKEYSNYRDVSLTFKNVSDKKIDAIRFRWYGEDAFGEPADMGNSFAAGFGGGFDDDPISPGKSRTSQWSILSKDGKKIILAWPTEVVFSDGTKWEIGFGK